MKTPMIQFKVHEVTAADLAKEGFEGRKLGDVLITSNYVVTENAIESKYKDAKGHKVSAEEAGTGIFAEAKEGDLGVTVDDKLFCSAEKLSELVAEEQGFEVSDLCEMSDELLDSLSGGAMIMYPRLVKGVLYGPFGKRLN